jgi:hypothetical protein
MVKRPRENIPWAFFSDLRNQVSETGEENGSIRSGQTECRKGQDWKGGARSRVIMMSGKGEDRDCTAVLWPGSGQQASSIDLFPESCQNATTPAALPGKRQGTAAMFFCFLPVH